MSRSKDLGSQWERDVARYFNENGYPHVERRYGAGNTKDKGDLNGFAHTIVIECKAVKSITLASICDETEVERQNGSADIGLAVIKRRGKGAAHAYAVIPLSQMVKLLHDGGY